MKTFAVHNIDDNEAPYQDVHTTKTIELGDSGFYFTAVCGSTDEIEAISMLGVSASEDTTRRGGPLISCSECQNFWRGGPPWLRKAEEKLNERK